MIVLKDILTDEVIAKSSVEDPQHKSFAQVFTHNHQSGWLRRIWNILSDPYNPTLVVVLSTATILTGNYTIIAIFS